MIEGLCWNERIAAAKAANCKFTDNDRSKASQWEECAVGEKFGLYTKDGYTYMDTSYEIPVPKHRFSPGDSSLAQYLGGLFDRAVQNDLVDLAEKIYRRVQRMDDDDFTKDIHDNERLAALEEKDNLESEYREMMDEDDDDEDDYEAPIEDEQQT